MTFKLLNGLMTGRLYLKTFLISLVYHSSHFWSDKLYLKIMYRLQMGSHLNLENPKTYNEKLQWIKLYDRKPEYSIMVDKVRVKDYVAEKIGEEYIIPTIGVWSDPEDIDFQTLPTKFVIKCNHNSGTGMYICTDKSKMDINKVKSELRKGLKENYYIRNREWPYKEVKRKILAEEFLEIPGQASLNDYKIMCFNGKAKLIELHEGRFTNKHTQTFYDTQWNITSLTQDSYGECNKVPSPKPALLEEMINLSEVLAKDIPHIRVDWYIVNNKLYFGELTFFDGSGFDKFIPVDYNYIIGSWITLPNITK